MLPFKATASETLPRLGGASTVKAHPGTAIGPSDPQTCLEGSSGGNFSSRVSDKQVGALLVVEVKDTGSRV